MEGSWEGSPSGRRVNGQLQNLWRKKEKCTMMWKSSCTQEVLYMYICTSCSCTIMLSHKILAYCTVDRQDFHCIIML